jgi:hypothetical protein
MCKIVLVFPGEIECSTHGELTEALGGAPLYKHVDDQGEGDCLCNLDEPRTAAAFGFEIASEPGDFMTVFSRLPSDGLGSNGDSSSLEAISAPRGVSVEQPRVE